MITHVLKSGKQYSQCSEEPIDESLYFMIYSLRRVGA